MGKAEEEGGGAAQAPSSSMEEPRGTDAYQEQECFPVHLPVPLEAGGTQTDGGARSMIPQPPRSRFAALPRLGLPPASPGGVGISKAVGERRNLQSTAYTSVFTSPTKSGVANAPPAADTPSRLARFREANWAAKESRKRPRGSDTETEILPPKSRIVTRLFVDETPPGATASSQEDGEDTSATSENKAMTGLNELDERARVEKESQIALGLHENLVRDSARLKLTMDNLKDEIDFYFDALARIEQVAARARATADRSDGTTSEEATKSVRTLAEGLQRIISAAKPTGPGEVTASSSSEATEDPHSAVK